MFKNYVVASLFLIGFAKTTQRAEAGHRSARHTFEMVSKALSTELEESYKLFIFINSDEGPTARHAFVPNQHMSVIKKPPGSKKVFKRNSEGVITGVVEGSLFLKDIIPDRHYERASWSGGFGIPFDWDGIEVVPISTGTKYFLPTFSGVYQINWKRSRSRYSGDHDDPMSNQLYVGYYYHDESIPESRWSSKNRDRVSYSALHGTPSEHWSLLGRSRGSHGCARVQPELMEGLYNYVLKMPLKKVIDLDWNFDLPNKKPLKKLVKTKPVLLVIFDGYQKAK